MAEKNKDTEIIALRFAGDFYYIWKEFERLSEEDDELNEVNFLKVGAKSKPIPVRIRNLIANYVREKRNKKNEE